MHLVEPCRAGPGAERKVGRPGDNIDRPIDHGEGALDEVLEKTNTAPGEIDKVFLTGGTSLVPAVRQLFERRFGPAKVAGGSEFVSVAEGLALIGAEAQDS